MFKKLIDLKKLDGQVCSGNYCKMEKKHCSGDHYGSYNSVDDAKAACSVDSNCQSVYHSGCSTSGTVFLCLIGSSYSTSTSSCIYEKEGILYY